MINKLLFYFCWVLYHYFAVSLPRRTCPFGKVSKLLRYQLCKRLFRYCGKNVNIEKGVDFGSGRHLSIDDNSGLGVNCRARGPITIGKNVMMGPDVVILTRNHDFSDTSKPMRGQGGITKPVNICDDVWIGTRAIILPGVTIGQGSVVGAGAVVTKEIPEFSIIGGCPAKIIKSRKCPKRMESQDE
ncbi:MAG: acyltransferase [Planctomycetaceae bacterium]|nr:acyltransferase [Planctomycetaceae bacterium]